MVVAVSNCGCHSSVLLSSPWLRLVISAVTELFGWHASRFVVTNGSFNYQVILIWMAKLGASFQILFENISK
jgi:hypothetical protein